MFFFVVVLLYLLAASGRRAFLVEFISSFIIIVFFSFIYGFNKRYVSKLTLWYFILFVFLNINARSSDNLTNKKSDNEIRFVEDKASNIETRKPFGFYYLENQINDREFYIYIYNIKCLPGFWF